MNVEIARAHVVVAINESRGNVFSGGVYDKSALTHGLTDFAYGCYSIAFDSDIGLIDFGCMDVYEVASFDYHVSRLLAKSDTYQIRSIHFDPAPNFGSALIILV